MTVNRLTNVTQPQTQPAFARIAAEPWLNAPTLPHRSDTQVALLPIPRIPNYEILTELGRGGMGVVYRAVQVATGKEVALKVLLSGPSAHALERERFRRETEAVSTLTHPHIVQLLESGEANGWAYLVFELAEHGTLAQRLCAEHPWDPIDAAKMVETLARAAHAAHCQGIVHRDIKPANVLFDGDTPKLCDFGLAKPQLLAFDGMPATEPGVIVGTANYIAPEQAIAELPPSPAADIYSLGAVLYELLTGQPPFDGRNMLDVVVKVVNDPVVPPSRLRDSLPTAIEAICTKCLSKSPTERYETAESLANDLRRFIEGKPVTAVSPITLAKVASWWSRLRLPQFTRSASVLAAALIAIVGLISISLGQFSRATPNSIPHQIASRTLEPNTPSRIVPEQIGRQGFVVRHEMKTERKVIKTPEVNIERVVSSWVQLREWFHAKRDVLVSYLPKFEPKDHTVLIQVETPDPQSTRPVPVMMSRSAVPLISLLRLLRN